MSKNTSIRILVVDDYDDIREVLGIILEGIIECQVTEASSGNEAIAIIEKDPNFDLIISDYNMPNGNGGKVFTHLRSHNVDIPFILLSSDSIESHSEFNNGKNLAHITKPFTDDSVEKTIQRMLTKEIPKEESQYLGVPLSLLTKIQDIRHPLHIKISDQKYVKVVAENTVFNQAELERFKEKHCTHLYIEKTHITDFFSIYQKVMLSQQYFDSMTIDTSLEALNANVDLLQNFSEQLGWSKETQALAEKNIQLAMTILSKTTDPFDVLRKLTDKKESYFATHSSLLALGSITLLKNLGWDKNYGNEKIAMASILHDMCLTPLELQNKRNFLNVIDMPEYEKIKEVGIIKEHTVKAAAFAEQMPYCHPDVVKIIRNHHENPKGTGFPNHLKAAELDQLSSVFILTEDIVDHYMEYPDENNLREYIATLENKYNVGIFQQAWQSLYQSCMGQKS